MSKRTIMRGNEHLGNSLGPGSDGRELALASQLSLVSCGAWTPISFFSQASSAFTFTLFPSLSLCCVLFFCSWMRINIPNNNLLYVLFPQYSPHCSPFLKAKLLKRPTHTQICSPLTCQPPAIWPQPLQSPLC